MLPSQANMCADSEWLKGSGIADCRDPFVQHVRAPRKMAISSVATDQAGDAGAGSLPRAGQRCSLGWG